MGSLEAACIAGFLCRLCSQMHRTVIHIYGDEGRRHGLADKINEFLPITVTPTDPLPKTICSSCMIRVEEHHKLIKKITMNSAVFRAALTRLNTTPVTIVTPSAQSTTITTTTSTIESDDGDNDVEEVVVVESMPQESNENRINSESEQSIT